MVIKNWVLSQGMLPNLYPYLVFYQVKTSLYLEYLKLYAYYYSPDTLVL